MISINPYEIVMQIVNFSVLFFLLKRFLFKPLVEFLDSREAQIQGALDDAKQSKASAEQLLQDQEAALKESRLKLRSKASRSELVEATCLSMNFWTNTHQLSWRSSRDKIQSKDSARK